LHNAYVKKRNFPRNYVMKNKKDIVELVQLYNVDHVFHRLKFRYKLDYTKYIHIINEDYSRKFFLRLIFPEEFLIDHIYSNVFDFRGELVQEMGDIH